MRKPTMTQSYKNRRTQSQRRGITLLFVISMIVLFLLMGTTFVVVSNNFFREAGKRNDREITRINAKEDIERGFQVAIRGVDAQNQNSAMRFQSVLADMYGFQGFRATITGTPASANIPGTTIGSSDQLIQLTVTGAQRVLDGTALDMTMEPFANSGSFNGCVLSFVSGEAKGISTRIYDYELSGGNPTFVIVAPRWRDGGAISFAGMTGETVIVNGREFSGTGAGGYTPGNEITPRLGEAALAPNREGEDLTAVAAAGGYLGAWTQDQLGVGQPNESYDGPDAQNMFLGGVDNNNNIIASFHRQSLTNYWSNRDPNATAPTEVRHLFSAFEIDNTGGNDQLVVDTDGDGIEDAIWVDIGAPIQTNAQGKRYKPLYAYRIVDLDSRLNLNTVGNQVDLGRVLASTALPVRAGQGFGPSGISPEGFLTNAEYQAMIQGDATTGDPGRYGLGADGVADSGDEVPGAPGRDAWSTKKLFGHPIGTSTVQRLYQTGPLDVRDRFAIATPAPGAAPYPDPNFGALVNNSMPSMDISIGSAADGLNESPYEANFSVGPFKRWEAADDDTPFEARELERLLRPFDVDSVALASRMTTLFPNVANDAVLRNQVTTDSWEVPVSALRAYNDARTPGSLVDVIRARVQAASSLTAAQVNNYIRFLLPPEVLAGRKMDINRAFGNGLDDSGDTVVDDPAEVNEVNLDDAQNAAAMDLNNDFTTGSDTDARIIFARHLYILTLTVCEPQIDTSLITVNEFRTAVAQWAINVVDFRDPDSINTPFEFDIDPWNGVGWADGAIDGIVNPGETDTGDRRLVWGMERPELLITETFLSHDRALEDLAADDGGSDDTAGGDVDFDSRLIPRSSAFIELYHPWTHSASHQVLPPELARTPASPTGVDLQRRTPNDNPVWRLVVKRTPTDPVIRSIYFTDLASTPSGVTDGGLEFSTSFTVPVLTPGTHAVIGSAGTSTHNVAGETGYRTTFGRLIGFDETVGLDLDETRSISLVPTANPLDNQIVRREWDTAGGAMTDVTTAGIAVVIDLPRSLSLSDPGPFVDAATGENFPEGGYPDADDNVTYPGTNLEDGWAYTVARDTPLDIEFQTDAADIEAIFTNGVTEDFRFIELQRLANPLIDWEADTNPYITIDKADANLFAFNGMNNDPDNNGPFGDERDGVAVNDGVSDPDSVERGETTVGSHLLFPIETGEAPAERGPQPDNHHMGIQIIESLGRMNPGYQTLTNRYPWLTWNNRPFMSQYELANVPFTSSENLTTFFSIDDTRDAYATNPPTPIAPEANLGGNFNHLLNFYGSSTGVNGNQANFHRLFDYTEVPSRYVGTEIWFNPTQFVNAPFNSFSSYRYPGKININTVQENVYNQLIAGYAGTLNYNTFDNSRWSNQTIGGNSVEIFRPYRNSIEANFVPLLSAGGDPNALVEASVDCGLLRRNNAATNSLFDFRGTDINSNSDRSHYFRNGFRQRLANMTTTRSSVFAIWITVGYFEVDETGALMTVNNGTIDEGVELGADTGEAVRHRGFYIFDRSIPMAFEPGQDHNIDRGILVKSIIE